MTNPAYNLGLNKTTYQAQLQLLQENEFSKLKFSKETLLFEKLVAGEKADVQDVAKNAARFTLYAIDNGFAKDPKRGRIPLELRNVVEKCKNIYGSQEFVREVDDIRRFVKDRDLLSVPEVRFLQTATTEQALNSQEKSTLSKLYRDSTKSLEIRGQAFIEYLKLDKNYKVIDADLPLITFIIEQREVSFLAKFFDSNPNLAKNEQVTTALINELNKLEKPIKKVYMKQLISALKDGKFIPKIAFKRLPWLWVKHCGAGVAGDSPLAKALLESGLKIGVQKPIVQGLKQVEVLKSIKAIPSEESRKKAYMEYGDYLAKMKILGAVRFELRVGAEKNLYPELTEVGDDFLRTATNDDLEDFYDFLSYDTQKALYELLEKDSEYDDEDESDVKNLPGKLGALMSECDKEIWNNNQYLTTYEGIAGSGHTRGAPVSWFSFWLTRMELKGSIKHGMDPILLGKSVSEVKAALAEGQKSTLIGGLWSYATSK